ncbi:MAG: NADH-quinone oxidoreductase subunit J [Chloroflexi bacterium]|nr:NADH-quinone oxidoreductase subunit J [Chloroflexota bacterium]
MTDLAFSSVFVLLGVMTLGSALAVVSLRNVVHAALFLIVSFCGIAGLFVLLNADFLAAVQILIYAGAIAILMIFAIMLTQNAPKGSPANERRIPAFIIAVLMMGTIGLSLYQTLWPFSSESPLQQTTAVIGAALFNKFVLPFEVASVLLLAAMIGAIILSREE